MVSFFRKNIAACFLPLHAAALFSQLQYPIPPATVTPLTPEDCPDPVPPPYPSFEVPAAASVPETAAAENAVGPAQTLGAGVVYCTVLLLLLILDVNGNVFLVLPLLYCVWVWNS